MSEIMLVRKDELYHYGVKGMKWGVRRRKDALNAYADSRRSTNGTKNGISRRIDANKAYKQSMKDSSNANKNIIKEKTNGLSDKQKKAIKVGAAVAGTALAAYGAYKVNQYVKTKNGELAAERGYKQAQSMFNRRVSDIQSSGTHAGNVRVDAGKMARDRANAASNDSFRTAAKNVRNYKKSGGNLNELRKVNSYGSGDVLDFKYRNYKRR